MAGPAVGRASRAESAPHRVPGRQFGPALGNRCVCCWPLLLCVCRLLQAVAQDVTRIACSAASLLPSLRFAGQTALLVLTPLRAFWPFQRWMKLHGKWFKDAGDLSPVELSPTSEYALSHLSPSPFPC